MPEDLQGLGIGGIFAVILIDRVLNFLRTRNGANPAALNQRLVENAERQTELLGRMSHQVEDLHEWHKPESNGFSWKNAPAIERLSRSIDTLVTELRKG